MCEGKREEKEVLERESRKLTFSHTNLHSSPQDLPYPILYTLFVIARSSLIRNNKYRFIIHLIALHNVYDYLSSIVHVLGK